MVSVTYICVTFLHTCPITAGALLPTARGQDETGTTTSTYCGAHNGYGYFLPDITYRRRKYASPVVFVWRPALRPKGWKVRWPTHAISDGGTRTYTRAAYILHRSL